MNHIRLVYLSVFFGIISILSFFNIIYSYYFNLYLNLNTYIYTLIVSIFLTFSFYFIKNKKKILIYDKILTIYVFFWYPNVGVANLGQLRDRQICPSKFIINYKFINMCSGSTICKHFGPQFRVNF